MFNNAAEYTALSLGLATAASLLPEFREIHVSVYGDSLLVINQLTGVWRILDPVMIALNHEVAALAGGFASIQFHHIPRAQNAVADGLANMGLTARRLGVTWGLRPASWQWAERGPRFGPPPAIPPCPDPLGPIPLPQAISPSMLAVALGVADASPLDIRFNAVEDFFAGCLHSRLQQWDAVLDGSGSGRQVRGWLHNRVNIQDLWQDREDTNRTFRGTPYPQATPPPMFLPNHASCYGEFQPFVDSAVQALQDTGAARVVGPSSDPSLRPHLVLPLGVEESKPRMFLDYTFGNLWFDGRPYTAEGVTDTLLLLGITDLQASLDAAQAYHHVGLDAGSQTFFGFEWKGSWLVFTCLPFGWNLAPFIFHSVMAQVAACLRRCFGMSLLTYLDDIYLRGSRLHRDPWRGGLATIYVAGQLLAALGFSIHVVKKSVLWPTRALRFLGLTVEHGRFTVPPHRTDSILGLARAFLAAGTVSGYSLESLLGKAQSTYLAFSTASFFTRVMQGVLTTHRARAHLHLVVGPLRAELEFWAGTAIGTRFVAGASAPWLSPAHITVVITAATVALAVTAAVAFTTESPFARYTATSIRWPGIRPPPAGTPRAWVILATVLWFFLAAHPSMDAPPAWGISSETSCHLDFVVPAVAPFQSALSSPEFLSFVQDAVLPDFLPRLRAANLRLTVRRIRRLASYGLGGRDLDGADYALADQFFERLTTRWGPFTAEAFASPRNARLPVFYSWFPAAGAQPPSAGVNALSQRYTGTVYSNPPFALLGGWIHFCELYQIRCVVIVPQWVTGLESTYWWPHLWTSPYERVLIAPSGTPGVFVRPTRRDPHARVPTEPWGHAVWAFLLDPAVLRPPPP
jgi:hypothetical protein